MDENTLRYLLADALVDEPSMGPVAHNALRAGIRIRRRRATGIIGGIAVIASVVGLFPLLSGLPPAGRPATGVYGKGIGGPRDRPVQLAFSPDGKILATADSDGTARLWNIATGKEIGAPIGSAKEVKDIAYSPDGKILATADSDGTVRLWSVATHREIKSAIRVTELGEVGGVLSVAFSPNGRTLATGGSDGNVGLWSVNTRDGVGKTWIAGGGAVDSVEFSPDGKLLLTISNSSSQLWSVASQQPVGRPMGQPNRYAINSAVFSPDGKLVGTASANSFNTWSVATRRRTGQNLPTRFARGLGGGGVGVAFTPDSKVLVTTAVDGTIRQWNLATGKQIRPVIAPGINRDEFGAEALSPDGKILATTSFSGDARLWILSKTYHYPAN